MKIFLQMTYGERGGVLEKTIRLIITAYGHVLIENIDEAEIVMTNSPEGALCALKDDENVMVAMLIFPGERIAKSAGPALARNFPGRVDMCHVIAFCPEDKEINIYLIEKGGRRNEDSDCG